MLVTICIKIPAPDYQLHQGQSSNVICVCLCLPCGLCATDDRARTDTELEMGPEIDLLPGLPGYIAGK